LFYGLHLFQHLVIVALPRHARLQTLDPTAAGKINPGNACPIWRIFICPYREIEHFPRLYGLMNETHLPPSELVIAGCGGFRF
jgi:hypothetical protein